MSSLYGISSGSSSFIDSVLGTSSSSKSKNNNTNSLSLSASLTDYSLLKSGSYKKLLNAYYKTENTQTEEEVKKTVTDLTLAKSDSSSAASKAKKLSETEFTSENMDKIVENVQAFVDSYNELLDSASEVDDRATLRHTLWMTQTTEKNSGLLSELGITIGEDNKLELDTDKLKEAKLTTMQSMFTGRNSYLYDITEKMEDIYKSATSALNKASSSNSYGSNGTYSAVSGILYDTES